MLHTLHCLVYRIKNSPVKYWNIISLVNLFNMSISTQTIDKHDLLILPQSRPIEIIDEFAIVDGGKKSRSQRCSCFHCVIPASRRGLVAPGIHK